LREKGNLGLRKELRRKELNRNWIESGPWLLFDKVLLLRAAKPRTLTLRHRASKLESEAVEL